MEEKPEACALCVLKGGDHIEPDGGCRHRNHKNPLWEKYLARRKAKASPID